MVHMTIKPGFSERAANSLNHWAIFPAYSILKSVLKFCRYTVGLYIYQEFLFESTVKTLILK